MPDCRESARPDADRLAVCQHPDGGDYIPLRDGEKPPASCFMECGCTPRLYVALEAVVSFLHSMGWEDTDRMAQAVEEEFGPDAV